jgi:periplasmic protein TonB
MELKKNPSKDVHRFSRHFFFAGLCMSIALVIMAFEWKTKQEPSCNLPQPPPETTFVVPDVPVTVADQPQQPKPVKKVQLFNPDKITEALNNPTGPDEPEVVVEFPGDIPPLYIELPREPLKDTFIVVEKKPLPIGGYETFYKHIGKSITYPKKARYNETEGKVFVEFVVNPYGEVVNPKIIKGIGSGCDEEAIRVLTQTKWEPGKQRGQPVNVKLVMPITFKLN